MSATDDRSGASEMAEQQAPELLGGDVREGYAEVGDVRLHYVEAGQHWRLEARRQLRAAHHPFAAIGADAFAERARVELLATGEKVRKREVDTHAQLTPQEEHIVRLARDGRTNPEIGAELFISARTVEWHLRKVFTKLGITSRRDLHNAVPPRDQHPPSG